MLWMLYEFNQQAYDLGYSANEVETNPFDFETNERYSWNRGKNQKFMNELI